MTPDTYRGMFREWEAHQAAERAKPPPPPEIVAAPLCPACWHPVDAETCWLCDCTNHKPQPEGVA